MVLYKRKEFAFIIPPVQVPPDTQCWQIPETGEIFPAYEAYLERLSFYNTKRFTDSISGESNLTFWEALEKEKQGSQDIDADFPEALREPILRRCQFSQKSRLNDLVASLFNDFKDNIVPGEQVQIQDGETGLWSSGTLRERTLFHDRPDMTRYFVSMVDEPGQPPQIACTDRHHVQRKPRTFTKYNLQRFLRHTIHRDRYEGAPWVVKPKYADQYRLDTQLPQHMTQEAIAAERKLQIGLRKGRIEELPSSFMVKDFHVMPRPGAKPSQQELQYVHEKFDGIKHNGEQVLQMRPAPQHKTSTIHRQETQPQPPPPPPIKYPIEDLQLEPKKISVKRPRLHDFTRHPIFPTEDGLEGKERLEMDAVGPLLETWNTLTVFAEFFELDGFTFDDFTGAMFVASEAVPCQLFLEVHCAVLNRLVDEDGKVLADTLAKAGAESDSESSSDEGDSSKQDETPNGVTPHSGNDTDVEMKEAPSTHTDRRHRASEMLMKVDWVERLRFRRYPDGGWTLIMVGLLDQLSSHSSFNERCERILSHLAPLDKPATAETAYRQYMSMSVNMRVDALEIITILIVETKAFKDHMEHLVTESTETRKAKVALQSQRKPLVADLVKLDQQAKLLRPDNLNQSQEQKGDPEVNGDAMADLEVQLNDQEDQEFVADSDESAPSSEEDEDEDEEQLTKNRRQSSRAMDMKRKREIEEEEKQIQEDTKEAAEYRKVLKELNAKSAEVRKLEDQIEKHDDELRENACHRTKLLGRDRFLNRYIWFERNGMPFEGDSASTEYGYANGRLWIQGPDLMEREGLVQLERSDEKQYQSKFKMTMQERRDLEEGDTQLFNACQWGYIDNPEEVDRLIDWLNVKGEREKALKKELTLWRQPIQEYMVAMREHLEEVTEEHSKLEDRPVGIATRKKLTVDLDRTRYPCLKWENTVALAKYNQLLSAGPPPKRGKKSRGPAPEPRRREASAQPERRATRQGTRFAR